MNRIGICFPGDDYKKMNFEMLSSYLMQLKDAGVTSFDFYTTLFLNNDNKLKQLINFLVKNDITITFHYNYSRIKNIWNYDDALAQYKKDLIKIRNNLKACNILYPITLVFHALQYKEEWNKYEHQQKLITIYKELSKFSKELNFIIAIETLSKNHPTGNNIGDDFDELEMLIDNVNNENFGICWDIGHTRLNHIETNSDIYLPQKLIDKVKFTHIHNIYVGKSTVDHLPITNLDYQLEEIEQLVKNKYQGTYSLEIKTENLEENILIYINSIKKLKQILKEIEEKYNEFRKDS